MPSYLGMDTAAFPGLAVLEQLRDRAGVRWCCAYLVAPSHPNAGWNGWHAQIRQLGLGVLPVYVGRQVTGPGADLVQALQGAADGKDCVAKLRAEAYGPGARVALDLENGPPYGQLEEGYVEDWAAEIRAGGYTPAAYCSHAMAKAVRARDPELALFVFRVPTVARTSAPMLALQQFPDIAESGVDQAFAWQFRQNVYLPDFALVVDLDVAATPDPSAP